MGPRRWQGPLFQLIWPWCAEHGLPAQSALQAQPDLPARPGLLGDRRLPRANASLAKPPYASLQSCRRWQPSFQHLGAPSCRLCPKSTSLQTGRTELVFLWIPCPRLVYFNSRRVRLLTSNGPWHGRTMSEVLSEMLGALRGTGSSVPSDALASPSIPQPMQRNSPNCHTPPLDLHQPLFFPVILLMRWTKLSPLFSHDLGDAFP